MSRPHDLLAYLTADWHLPEKKHAGAWTAVTQVYGDAIFALAQIVNLCTQHGAHLLAAGDLFDGPDPEPEVLCEVYSVLRLLGNHDLKCYYVLGNHDRNRDWLAPVGDFAIRLDGRVETIPGTNYTVTGLSYRSSVDEFRQSISQLTPTTIGLYHQRWTEFASFYPALSGGFAVKDLPANELALCGDIHVNRLIQCDSGPRYALSPGALAPQNVTDATEFNPVVYSIDSKLEVREHVLRSREYVVHQITSLQDAEQAVHELTGIQSQDDLPEHIRTPFVTVRVDLPIEGLYETLDRLAQERNFVLRTYSPNTRVTRPDDKKYAMKSNTGLAGAIAAYDAPPDVKRLATLLVEANVDCRDVLQKERVAFETGSN